MDFSLAQVKSPRFHGAVQVEMRIDVVLGDTICVTFGWDVGNLQDWDSPYFGLAALTITACETPSLPPNQRVVEENDIPVSSTIVGHDVLQVGLLLWHQDDAVRPWACCIHFADGGSALIALGDPSIERGGIRMSEDTLVLIVDSNLALQYCEEVSRQSRVSSLTID